MSDFTKDIKKEIDKLYKQYYNTGYRETALRQSLMLKIAALKYKIKNIKKEEENFGLYKRNNRNKD